MSRRYLVHPQKFISMNIHCLMVSGLSLTDSLRTRLFIVACNMAKNGNARKILKEDDCAGMVTTEYKSANMGGISGVVFHADLEMEERQGKVRFIVRPTDISARNMEEFVWATID